MYLAEYCAIKGYEVILLEKESDFMQRASFVNQARVHNGYHYPRSILTALRSRVSMPRFCNEFNDCIDDSFDKYYMISRLQSKVSAKQFEKFCHHIGAMCEPAPPKITNLVDSHYIEAVFLTKEYAFDSVKLRKIMFDRLQKAGVVYRLNHRVHSVKSVNRKLRVDSFLEGKNDALESIEVDEVFNCTYTMINQILTNSSLEIIPLKHELAEMILIDVPDELKHIGITVMDGPFFSMMPFPSKGLHSLSHVRYTPHFEWHDSNSRSYRDAHRHYAKIEKQSAYRYMLQDAKRYLPILSEVRYKESLWEVKTLLPHSESSDARPIFFKPNYGLQGFHLIMGGKIDNVYDVIEVIEKTGLIDG